MGFYSSQAKQHFPIRILAPKIRILMVRIVQQIIRKNEKFWHENSNMKISLKLKTIIRNATSIKVDFSVFRQ